MWKTPLPWKAELCVARNSAFRVQLGNLITYLYVTMDQAKRACEQHCAAGCDLSKAERIIR